MAQTYFYPVTGFHLLSCLDTSGTRVYQAAAVDIVLGDALHDDTNGYATNATTALAATFLGVAAATVSNSGGSSGDLNINVIPPQPHYQFIVPVKADTVLLQTHVGAIYDLQEVNNIDLADTTIAAGPGFFIDKIDISAAAIAANTYGYAIGHFQLIS